MAKDDKQGLKGRFAATDAAKSPFHDVDAVGAAHVREAEQVSEDLSRERISKMSGTDNNTRMTRVAGPRRESAQDNLQRRAKQTFNDQIFLSMLQQNIAALQAQVADIEDGLRERYGENFAEVIAAKYLDDGTAQRRPGESDEVYWRRIALEIQRRVEAGEINPDDPLVKQWAKKSAQLVQAEEKQRAYIAENAEALAASGELKNQESTNLWQAEGQVGATAKDDVQDTFVGNSKVDQDSGAVGGLGKLAEFAGAGLSITKPAQTEALTETPTPEPPKIG